MSRYQDIRRGGFSGGLTAMSGAGEGSTRGMKGSSYYSRSEAGRGDGLRSIWNPSSSDRHDRNESQGRGHVDYPHTSYHRYRGVSDEESGVPYTADGEGRYLTTGSSRPHAMSLNGRDFHEPPSARMNSSEDAHAIRSEPRSTLNRAASFNGRVPFTPSLVHTPNVTQSTHMKQTYSQRPTSSTRPTRQDNHTTGAHVASGDASRRPRRVLKTGFHAPTSSSDTHRKHVRFEDIPPGSISPPSHISLAPAPKEEDDNQEEFITTKSKGEATNTVDVAPSPRSSSLVAIILQSLRRLLGSRKRSLSSARLHPLLRVPNAFRAKHLSWDVRRSPLLSRSTLPGVSSLIGPATSPPTATMRLIVDVPGLTDVQWSITVWPFDSPRPQSRSSDGQANSTTIRCIDVLHALYTLLQRRIKEHEYWGLEKSRRDRVSEVFWERCSPTTAVGGDPSTEARFGVRRVDLLDAWKWGGLKASGRHEWTVRFSETSGT